MSERPHHHLAAIMFTDIVGYTAIMQQNREKAMATVKEHEAAVYTHINRNGGELIQTYGDGSLSIFESASAAVQCAKSIQEQLRDTVPLRIGLHIGEITRDGDHTFGDGVNIASRIESMGVAGAVLFSKEVYSKIRNRSEFTSVSLGLFSFKNVEEAMEVFALANHGFPLPFKKEDKGESAFPFKWAIPLLVVLGAMSAIITWNLKQDSLPPTTSPIEYFDLVLPEKHPLAFIGSAHYSIGQPALAVSPDGNVLVYAAISDSTTGLVLYQLEEGAFHLLPGTEGAFYPFFSPDGQWIAFYASNQLKKISIRGEKPFTLAEVVDPFGGTWLESGKILFCQQEASKLSWISASGGAVEDLDIAGESREEIYYTNNWHSAIPGTDYILMSKLFPDEIYAFSPQTGEKKVILKGGSCPRYLSSGHLIYILKGSLMAVPLDKRTLQTRGEPVPVLDHLRTETFPGGAQFTFSETGNLFYVEGTAADLGKMVWVDLHGKEQVLPFKEDYFGTSKVSHDGKKVASAPDLGGDIWIYNLTRSTRTRIVNEGLNMNPLWFPQDEKLLFASKRNGEKFFDLFSQNYQARDQEEKLFYESDYTKIPSDISSDGKLILFQPEKPDTKADIWIYRAEEPNPRAEPLIQTEFSEYGASFSPDQRFIIYMSDQTGQAEVYLQPFPLTGEIHLVSDEGGAGPLWSPTGDRIYYRNGDRWMEVSVNSDPELQLGKPRLLFKGLYLNPYGPSFDVHPDGKRFLMVKPVDESKTSSRIKVIRNWVEVVRRKTVN